MDAKLITKAVLATLLLSLCPFAAAAAQTLSRRPAPRPVPAGGGEFSPDGRHAGVADHAPGRDAPTGAERRQIQSRIEYNRAALQSAGVLAPRGFTAADAVRLDFPLRGLPGHTGPGFHGVSNFVDQDAAYPDSLEDYSCGSRTYDTGDGYNHPGTDFFLWPFPWYRMQAGAVEVVAAAPGTIVLKQDGQPDQSCATTGGSWNAIYVEHADGTVAWYGHLKSGSLTAEPVGAAVARGEYLGRVGSSGNSSGPHLHFELQDASGAMIDPYQGSCNATSSESWWIGQAPYIDSAVNELATHSAPPELPACPQPERPHYRDRFAPGDTVYLAAYYRDQAAGQVSRYTVRTPDGAVYSTWDHAIDEPHFAASYWYWFLELPADAPRGAWSFTVDYEGTAYEHTFEVVDMLFTDDFESGDLGAWSAASPSP